MLKIISECPSCGGGLFRLKDQLYCTNKSDCPAQSSKRVEHYCKVLKIMGLGPKTLAKLGVYTITDIYAMSLDMLTQELGSTMGPKLHREILEATSRATLATILEASSIQLIGSSKAGKVAALVSDVGEIPYKLDEIKSAIGEKATDYLSKWLALEFPELEEVLPESVWKSSRKTAATGSEVVCITGKLTKYKNRSEAEAVLSDLGYECSSSVTKKVNFLVNESGDTSSKASKAKQYGIPEVSMEFLIRRKNTHE